MKENEIKKIQVQYYALVSSNNNKAFQLDTQICVMAAFLKKT